ncbi:peptidoglycan-binding protein [Streptomyces sp. NBC_00503]|uniref:peptidoglycan-binding protein n=1 Tax=Streptomyces sp. NBC_00503 TaxID=2903659 RepID=UPI002E8093DD|nr:peptidoglycan-binding protein [Streptomyces sp. NBC_00503]WUD81927.1 peptidoglycan-binding protein [Streptomyces sp. NBC_00503]
MSKRGKWLLSSLAAVLAVTGGGYAVVAQAGTDGKGTGQQHSDGLPGATAPVTRGDLSSGLKVDGTLGYAQERKLNAPGAGAGAGGAGGTGTPGAGGSGTGSATLTWVAPSGSSVERDGKIYEVNGKPVRLMYGTTPMYRTMKSGDKGEDVKQLKRNLQALGFGVGLDASDGTFTEGTATGVKRWQKSHKMKETGEVGKEDIAFASGPQRVQKNDMAVGDEAAAGKPVLTLTGTERTVRFQLDVAKAGTVKTGDPVTVSLPGGGTANGKIASVGSTANPDDPGSGGGGGGGGDGKKPKVEVEVTLDNASEAKGPDQSPVSVSLTGETRKGVLSVPVNALLALAGGGFGVQVVEDGKVREVKVELGMFGNGRVEVKGGALKEGMHVGVPQS